MSIADFRVRPLSGPYVLGPDGRLHPCNRKKDLQNRIRLVLRSQAVVDAISDGLNGRVRAKEPPWIAAFDAVEESEDV